MIFYCGPLLLRLELERAAGGIEHTCAPPIMPRWGWKAPHAVMLALVRLRGGDSSPCGTAMPAWLSGQLLPALRWSCPAAMMGSTCAATCVPVIRALIPATGPNLFRKQGYPAHAGNCYCARLARLHAIFSEPTSVIRQRWQLSQGGGWWSLKGPN